METFRDDYSPILENIPIDIKQKMRKLRTRSAKILEHVDKRDDDEVFIVEAILKRNMGKYFVKVKLLFSMTKSQ